MMGNNTLTAWDYVVFGGALLMALGIGLFYGCTGGKVKTSSDFMLGNRQMSLLPVVLSLIVSFISSATLLGGAAEVYLYGAQMMLWCVGIIVMTPIVTHLYYPLYYDMKLASIFEYLDARFNKVVRAIVACLYIVQMVTYMTIILYAPSLAFNTVTGFNTWAAVFTCGVVCTLYTALGGIKAVMWSDVFQAVLILAGMLAVLIKGSMVNDGFSNIWQHLEDGDRADLLGVSADPRERHTLWTEVIGIGVMWVSVFASNQAQVQRILTLPSKTKVTIAMYLVMVGMVSIMVVSALCSIVAYSEYRYCDPKQDGRISSYDQLLPLYVMDRLYYPGIPGLFIAAIFGGSLSSISSGLNSLATVTMEDLLKNLCIKDISDKRATIISKIIVCCYGVVMMALSFLIAEAGIIFQLGVSLFGIIGGSTLGVINLGMFYPWINSLGATAGFLSAIAVTGWLAIGKVINKVGSPKRPLLNECSVDLTNLTTIYATTSEHVETSSWYNGTTHAGTESGDPGYWVVYEISYTWYTVIALIVSTVVGFLVSFLTGANKIEDVEPRLLSPVVRRLCCKTREDKLQENENKVNGVVDREMEGYSNPALDDTKDS